MAEIRSPRVWTRQPQGDVHVNWSNPLTRNLLALIDPRSKTELVRGSSLVGARKTSPALSTGVATDRNSTGYLGIKPPTSASSDSAYLDISSGDITVFALCAQIGTTENANYLFGRLRGSQSPNYAVGLHTGTFNGAVVQLGTYGYSPQTSDTQRLNQPLPVAVVGSSGTAYTYFRGVQVDSGAYTQIAYEYDGSGGRAVSIGSGGYGLSSVGVCYLGAIWSRALSASEIAEISRNPWQLFAPQEQVSYFIPPETKTPIMQATTRIITRQPQSPVVASPPVSVAVSGAFPKQNLVGNGKAFTNTNPIISGQYERAISFDRTTGSGINTGFIPGTITRHSGILLVKHRDLSSLNSEAYISTRSVTNTGFGFNLVNADGIAPSRTFKLRYTHFSIADYDCTVAISGGDNAYVTVGFSASVNGVVRFFAKGRFLQQISIGSMTANTNTVTIGQDPSTLGSKAHYDLPFCAYWSNRFLSDAEHMQYANNPWQLFAPQRQVSYFLPPTTPITIQKVKNRNIQPINNTKINWSDPLTRGMVSCLELTNNKVVDLASTLTFNHTRPVTGTIVGKAAAFDGTVGINTGVTSINGQNLFATTGNPFTVMIYARRTADGTFIAKASANNGTRTFQIYSQSGFGYPVVYLRGSSVDSGLNLNDSNWHLYTVSFDGTAAKFFCDRFNPVSVPVGTAAEEVETISIGARSSGSGFIMSGNTAFVRIWSRALSQDEHRSFYENPWRIFTQQQPGYFPASQTQKIIEAPSVWTRQPRDPIQINWNNPLSKDLVSSLELTRNGMRDYASGLTFNHTRPIIGTQKGLAANFNGTAGIDTGVKSIKGQNLLATSTNPFSVMVLARRTGEGNFIARCSAGDSLIRQFQFYYAPSIQAGSTPGVNFRGSSQPTNLGVSDTEWHLYTVVWNGASGVIYVDANKSASLNSGSAAEEVNENIIVGARSGGTGLPLNGDIAFTRIWSRALSLQEHLLFVYNPWQIFASPSKVGYFDSQGTIVIPPSPVVSRSNMFLLF